MNIHATKIEAIQFAVEVKENYNDVLTIIFNNVRDRADLLKVTNNHANLIFVTVKKNIADYTKEWLSGFGIIKKEYNVLVALINTDDLLDYDFDKYDDFIIAED